MLLLLALLSLARAQIESAIVTQIAYENSDTGCAGQIAVAQTQTMELGECVDESDDDSDFSDYFKYTCNGNTADSTVTQQHFGPTQCTPGATSTDTILTSNTCTLHDGDNMKFLFNCADGTAVSFDDSGMIGQSMKVYAGTGCTGSTSSSDDQTFLFRPDVCLHTDTNEYGRATCSGDSLVITTYTDSGCTTVSPDGSSTTRAQCIDFMGLASVQYDLINCGSAAAELTIFGLVLVALSRF